MTTKLRDKLYRVGNGELTTATFLKEHICDGATLVSWLVRKEDGTKTSCAPDSWELTELAAWMKYYKEMSDCTPLCIEAAQDAQQKVNTCIEQLNVACFKIAQLGQNNEH